MKAKRCVSGCQNSLAERFSPRWWFVRNSLGRYKTRLPLSERVWGGSRRGDDGTKGVQAASRVSVFIAYWAGLSGHQLPRPTALAGWNHAGRRTGMIRRQANAVGAIVFPDAFQS